MTARRHVLRLGAGLACIALPALARAVQSRSLDDPLRLAVDDALVESGLAQRLQRAFAHDTGVAVGLQPGPATAVLQALERGERDAALTNAPDVEAPLERDGLAHDRRRVALSEFVLVGPAALARPLADVSRDIGLALARVAQAQVPFVTRADGSGTHLAELSAWRAARLAPAGAWYVEAGGGRPLLAEAHARQACTLVERGVWAAHSAKGFAVLAERDPRLAVDVHVMRSFRVEHPAGRLFVGWLAGAKGRAVAASHRGYRPARG